MSDTVWINFTATVIEVLTDPLEQGRVKIRVDGVHGPDIDDADLPYAAVVQTCTGGTSGVGENTQLLPGARVIGVFTDGILCQSPIITGCLVHTEKPSESQCVAEQSANAPLVSIFPNFRQFQTIAPRKLQSQFTLNTLEQRKRAVWDFFTKKDSKKYKRHIIAGIIGNLIVESNIDSTKFQGKDKLDDQLGPGRGIAQWTFKDRWVDCVDLARKAKISEFDLIHQLEFIHRELQNDFYAGNLLKVSDATGAAITFMRNYERPRRIKPAGKPRDGEGVSSYTSGKYIISKYGGFGLANPKTFYPEMEGEDRRVKLANAAYREFTESR